MTTDLPLSIVTGAVWTYWICVVVMTVRSHLRYRTAAGGLPQTTRERWMWTIWMPAVLSWQILPSLAAHSSHSLLATSEFMKQYSAIQALRWVAALAAVLAFALTVPCWLSMGRNWSMAIVPKKKSRLVTKGMFARVRHPIYSLSILLMGATILVTASAAMTLVGIVHIVMISMKAASEETYLHQLHGQKYADYCAQTGRFVPRTLLFPADQSDRKKAA
ncbi:MAG: isoprenylcysteine carboxylmethyltransferase family protein [Planctomycetes bacterium]|nr:isoprenylcysteine carboxylmethyltransferase family protein [Planctomycetota bacterium]